MVGEADEHPPVVLDPRAGNVEGLTFSSIERFHLIGGSADDELYGLDGDDCGGGGTDVMAGGDGDDTYVFEQVDDLVTENENEGIDTIRSRVRLTLPDNVENLVLVGAAGNADGRGNALDNEITGNGAMNELEGFDGDDVLDGGGGADILRGGRGDDVYIVNGSGQVVEISGALGGIDLVKAKVSFTLSDFIENLVLISAGIYDLTGNGLANDLTGNGSSNWLDGRGGADTMWGLGGDDLITAGIGDDRIFGGRGNDSLRGDGGTDRFYFDTPLNASSNVDDLVDFTPADDWILLDQDIFSGISTRGVLSASAFRLGTAALDASDRILYHQATGRIFYDADGAGGAAAILFATVPDGTPVTYADFFVIG